MGRHAQRWGRTAGRLSVSTHPDTRSFSAKTSIIQRRNLFGEDVNVFVNARDAYGVWPFTVWEIDDSTIARVTKQLRTLVGDTPYGDDAPGRHANPKGRSRHSVADHKLTRHKTVDGTFRFQVGASVFNPGLACIILNMFGPEAPGSMIVDPFAGGGTRAFVCTGYGYHYTGTEIRQEEVDVVWGRLVHAGLSERARIHCADGRRLHEFTDNASMCFTCPPYWDMEQYDGGPDDLSMEPTYDGFLEGIRNVVISTWHALRPGALSVWVLGLHRDRDGALLGLHHDVARIHAANGFRVKEEIILYRKHSGAGPRTTSFLRGTGNRYLARTHEYAMVFERGA